MDTAATQSDFSGFGLVTKIDARVSAFTYGAVMLRIVARMLLWMYLPRIRLVGNLPGENTISPGYAVAV